MAQVTVEGSRSGLRPFAPVVDCAGRTTREVNRAIHELLDQGATEICVANPQARHNLGVALTGAVELVFTGPVGWYVAGMNDGPSVTVHGNCGWGAGECMMSGRVEIHGHAGSGTAASIRGGFVSVDGNAGARAGIAMKGGTLVVAGNVGYMSGFMMQQGTIVVGGDAADGLGDSMYEGVIYIAGRVASYGADAVEAPMTDDDVAAVEAALGTLHPGLAPERFRRIEAGRKLWNFSTKEAELWRAAL